MKFVIVTGMSGSGKKSAVRILEDHDYFCVDNMPIELILKFAEISDHKADKNVALGIDVRSGDELSQIDKVLSEMKARHYKYEILFLECSDKVLLKRYKESRRPHPLAPNGSVEEGITKEREQLAFLKNNADYIIDTSQLLVKDLKHEMEKIFIDNGDYRNLFVTVSSFGFKYGTPADADLIMDVRFLPNPYYDEKLKYKTGNEKEVQEYVMSEEYSHVFLKKLLDMVVFLIPYYIKEGKNQLVIAIGCTGGKHRSVTIANKLFDELSKIDQLGVKILHRDVERDK